MSHTVICGPDFTDSRITNEVNRAVRHCCIGHVKWKYRNPFTQPFTPALRIVKSYPGGGSSKIFPRAGEVTC